MSNGNSKLPPNSGMSDERWLSKDERDVIGGWFQQRQPNREAFENADVLLDHAEAADELIAELAACLRTHVAFSTTADGMCAWPEHSSGGMAYYNSTDTLARVDALTKDTA